MDLADASSMAKTLMLLHGLRKWTFGLNRAKRRLGVCHYDRKRIELSRHLVLLNDDEVVREVLLHEIAHALAGREAGHGEKWRQIALRIGARPERTGEAKMPLGDWRATCETCGKLFTSIRKPRKDYRCRCDPEADALVYENRKGDA